MTTKEVESAMTNVVVESIKGYLMMDEIVLDAEQIEFIRQLINHAITISRLAGNVERLELAIKESENIR